MAKARRSTHRKSKVLSRSDVVPANDRSANPERRLYAGRWSGGAADSHAGDAHLPVRFPELWNGIVNVIVRFGLPPQPGSLYPVEIWEVCCAALLTVLRERHTATAKAAVNALADRLPSYWPLHDQGPFTLAELVARIDRVDWAHPLGLTPRRGPEYPARDIRPVVRALQQELKAETIEEDDESGKFKQRKVISPRYRRGRGYVNSAATLAYIRGWWHRRAESVPPLSEHAERAKYPQDEVHTLVSEPRPPSELALFLVAKRYAISEEAARKSLRRRTTERG